MRLTAQAGAATFSQLAGADARAKGVVAEAVDQMAQRAGIVEAEAGPDPAPATAADAAGPALAADARAAQALALRSCANLACTSLAAASEEEAWRASKKCGACRQVRYCTQSCCKQDWRAHKRVCALLAAEAKAAAAAGRQGGK